MLTGLRHFLLAVQFFTRIPIVGGLARWVGYSPQMLRASAAYFPLVGLMVGALCALSLWLMMAVLPNGFAAAAGVAVVLVMIQGVLLTGGLHEDGLADVADGLGGGYDRANALRIMKDSRMGAYAGMALFLALLAKWAMLNLLVNMALPWAMQAMVLAHGLSRFFPLITIRTLPHVGDSDGSKSKPLAEQIGTGALWLAAFWVALMLLAAWLIWGKVLLVPLLLAVLMALVGWWWVWRKLQIHLGGFTGDGLGATQQVCELGVYLGLILGLNLSGVV